MDEYDDQVPIAGSGKSLNVEVNALNKKPVLGFPGSVKLNTPASSQLNPLIPQSNLVNPLQNQILPNPSPSMTQYKIGAKPEDNPFANPPLLNQNLGNSAISNNLPLGNSSNPLTSSSMKFPLGNSGNNPVNPAWPPVVQNSAVKNSVFPPPVLNKPANFAENPPSELPKPNIFEVLPKNPLNESGINLNRPVIDNKESAFVAVEVPKAPEIKPLGINQVPGSGSGWPPAQQTGFNSGLPSGVKPFHPAGINQGFGTSVKDVQAVKAGIESPPEESLQSKSRSPVVRDEQTAKSNLWQPESEKIGEKQIEKSNNPMMEEVKTVEVKPQPIFSVAYKKIEPKVAPAVLSTGFDGIVSRVIGSNNLKDSMRLSNLNPNPPALVSKKVSVPIKLNKEIPHDPLSIKPVKFSQDQMLQYFTRTIKTLLELVSYNRFLSKYQEIHEKLINMSSGGSQEAEKVLSHLTKNLYCRKCDSKKLELLLELSCGHLICKVCLEKEANFSIERNIFLCPECKKNLNENEETKIWQQLGLDKSQKQKTKLEAKFRAEKQLKCTICKKFKKKYYPSCLHICKECFAEKMRWGFAPCYSCHASTNYNYNDISKETFFCADCENQFYFVGSYAKYFKDESLIFCLGCSYNFFNQGSNEKFQLKLSKLEKLELNEHIFATCAVCRKEIFKDELRIGTCGHKVCSGCRSEEMCVACNLINS